MNDAEHAQLLDQLALVFVQAALDQLIAELERSDIHTDEMAEAQAARG